MLGKAPWLHVSGAVAMALLCTEAAYLALAKTCKYSLLKSVLMSVMPDIAVFDIGIHQIVLVTPGALVSSLDSAS